VARRPRRWWLRGAFRILCWVSVGGAVIAFRRLLSDGRPLISLRAGSVPSWGLGFVWDARGVSVGFVGSGLSLGLVFDLFSVGPCRLLYG